MNQLPVPPIAMDDPRAREVLRVWVADGKQHFALVAGVWKDPGAWGLLLVDLARHAAKAYHEAEGRDSIQVLARIREGFDAEWAVPTDDPG